MNPLRIDDKPGEDTRGAVRSVLSFMTEALHALERSDDCLCPGALSGAAEILNVCFGALKEPEPEGATDGQ